MTDTRLSHLFIILAVILGLSGTVPAQSFPVRVDSTLLSRSIEQVTGSKHYSLRWHFRPVPGEAREYFARKGRIYRQLPDSIRLGILDAGNRRYFLLIGTAPSKATYFTFALYLKPTGAIADVDVLIYREERGNEIDHPLFRKQFRGKREPGQLTFGRKIRKITGATLSARSITLAVREMLQLFPKIRESSDD